MSAEAMGMGGAPEFGPEGEFVRSMAALYRFLEPGELLTGIPEHAVFESFWASSRSDSFAAPEKVTRMRESKSF